jgi:alanine racemase
MEYPLVWAEIDLDAIAHNVRELKNLCHPDTRMEVAVKANGYGHGIFETAQCALDNGADSLAVARIWEGICLREAGIEAPIHILGYTPTEFGQLLLHHSLTQTVYDVDNARALSETAFINDKKLTVHIKIDTGMGRLGIMVNPKIPVSEPIRQVQEICQLNGLHVEGIFTHFACADEPDKTHTLTQFERFTGFLDELEKNGIQIPVRHAANSAAAIDLPETRLDMIRPGIAVYGLYPSEHADKSRVKLKPAMSLKTKIIQIKDTPAGYDISYGATWQTPEKTRIATVPVGYGDGYNRLLSSRGEMLVEGRRAPVVGRVCMDLTMLDVGHIPEAKVGSEVVILGQQGSEGVTADDIARLTGTINYEVVTAIAARVPRIYTK